MIDLHFDQARQFWADAAGLTLAQVEARFQLGTPAHRAMETGGSDAAFFAALRIQIGGRLSPTDLETGWNLILGHETAGVREAIDEYLRRAPGGRLAVLSNTNATHEAIWQTRLATTLTRFEKVYCSHRIGAIKPDAAAFSHVCADLQLNPGEILFFDDTLENVVAARALGMQAMHIKQAGDLRTSLSITLNPGSNG